jgi:hypothetical protein
VGVLPAIIIDHIYIYTYIYIYMAEEAASHATTSAFQGAATRRWRDHWACIFLTSCVWRSQTEPNRAKQKPNERLHANTRARGPQKVHIHGHVRDLRGHIQIVSILPAPISHRSSCSGRPPNVWSALAALPSHQSHCCIPPAAIGCATASSG